MNFLSHFYFDRYSDNPERTIGMVLPDLVKNARKEWTLRPEKHPYLFIGDEKLTSILEGWERHLAVDRYFHSSDFFCTHTRNIKVLILPSLAGSVVRPSFVAHIALELMLDSLLLADNTISTETFYDSLARADRNSLTDFLNLNKIADTPVFFDFLDDFIQAEYLNSYRRTDQIIYAIGRVCMRLWINPFTEMQKIELTAILTEYLESLKDDYMLIFDQIEGQLTPYT